MTVEKKFHDTYGLFCTIKKCVGGDYCIEIIIGEWNRDSIHVLFFGIGKLRFFSLFSINAFITA